MSYIARVYKKKFLETNGLDITIIDILLKKDLNRLQEYLDQHTCMHYYEAEEVLLDFWVYSKDKKDKRYKDARLIINKAGINSKKLLQYWKDRKKEE